ncbi:hypothetical protein LLH06_13120 [Mucilaginibacter daejeonensis]|uniref:hypothetical protein n=1 Tax=Mucilaginibacter daejeonensis TaxID=398049 RepID=UPI001D177B78|nr:hypothetical protein [Mucilaginibacter daejeonensis]UEG51902.1 hypothetical protein LLH06_13120 [Mucilaginibacter daejeonensis]
MKIIVLAILILTVSIACNSSQNSKTSASPNADTIILKGDNIVFISPSEKSVKELKKKYGEDFYTIADDANNYFAEASSYLDSLKVPYNSYDDSKTTVYKDNKKVVKILPHTSPWYAIFYKNGKYQTLDLIDLKERYSTFFTNKSNMVRTVLDAKHVIDSVAGKRYFVVEEKDCDLNSDTFIDKIVVLGNNSDADTQDPATKIAPVTILMNDHDQRYTVLINEKIYPNDFGDAFKRLVVKDNYFTIELSNEIPYQYVSEKYITFRFDKLSKEIVLSKYGENINWHDGKRTETRCSDKDFGKILFQMYDSNSIKAYCSK